MNVQPLAESFYVACLTPGCEMNGVEVEIPAGMLFDLENEHVFCGACRAVAPPIPRTLRDG